MRAIETHKVNGLNEALQISVLDDPGQGNMCHRYQIRWDGSEGPMEFDGKRSAVDVGLEVKFQNGPVKEHGVNGISNEALLAIVLDRLEGAQAGEYKCRENALAITKLEEAMHWLMHRTRARMARGVEGTSAK